MPQTSFAILTNLGRAKEAAALANAATVTITHIAIGDGATVPSGGETQLYHEIARKTISGHGTVSGADNVAYFDCYLAAGDGPFTIREAGLYDNVGDLIAIAHYDPPINKPVPSSGQTVEGTVRLEVAFSNIATVVILVDPSMQVALQRLTRLPWIPIIELYRNAPPASPAVGDAYVIGPSPTGSWAGNGGKVAEFTIAGWAMITPPAGHGVSIPDGRVYEMVSGSYVEKIAIDAQSGKWTYAADAGAANALAGTLVPTPPAIAAGFNFRVKVAANNTGAASFNGIAIKRKLANALSDLLPGDLSAGMIAELTHDGTNLQLLNAGRPDNSNSGLSTLFYSTPGTYSFVVPAGVYALRVKMAAGGGGGGGASTGTGQTGGGGGGGACLYGSFAVLPSTTLTIVVGDGGAGGGAEVGGGQNGASTTLALAGVWTLICNGGNGGFFNSPPSGGGQGGDVSSYVVPGGNGIAIGGGGGGSGQQLNGATYAYGGLGGATMFGGGGHSNYQSAAAAGRGYGSGGGGGALETLAQAYSGGKGAPGIIILEY